MFSISYDDIYLTRGDTAVINFNLSNYELQDGDTVLLTVKQSVDTADIAFQKVLDKETNQFVIEHNDTKNLPYGKYVYDIQLTTAQGQVYTIIKPHRFKIEGEVTWDE